MPFEVSEIETIINEAVPRIAPAVQLAIRSRGKLIYSQAFGYLDLETNKLPTRKTSLFDMASVTKLFTTTAFMRLVELGSVGVDDPVSQVLPEFNGERRIQPYEDPIKWGSYVDLTGSDNSRVDAGKITFRQILRHSSGLPAWRAFKDQPTAQAARQMALKTFFAYPPDTRVVYSDVGLILLGMAVEKLTALRLDAAINELVTEPLGLQRSRFLPNGSTLPLEAAPTEFCRWRNRRVIGEVHDESASRLGGIAGHAGIFSTAEDIAALGQSFLPGPSDVPSILRPETIAEMVKPQFEDGDTRRGLGFALWSPDPDASSNPFSPRTFGHTGFTGTSLWIDPDRALVVALLTNDVYYGREGRGIMPLRVALHRAVVEAADDAAPVDPAKTDSEAEQKNA